MSGLEVLGAITGVLGILPVAVEALKTYKSILSSIRNAQRDLLRLIRDLETEQVRLKTTCEILLEGIAPISMIDGMTVDPFGAAWEQYSHLLRLRLWESEREFKNVTLDMNNAAVELREKLCIYRDGSPKPTDKVSIIREIRKGASFTLNKKDYVDIISRIKSGNQALSELAGQNRGLEPSRRRRSQARLIKLVRGLSHEIFQAIQNATTCPCVASHRVCLELAPRDAVLTPSDVDDIVARSFKFHVALDSESNNWNYSTDGRYEPVYGQLLTCWKNMYFRLGSFGNNIASRVSSLAPPISDPPTPPRSPRFVSWHRSNKSPRESYAQGPSPRRAMTYKRVTDLCQMLTYNDKQPARDCVGYITSIDRTFGMYPPTRPLDQCAVLTLREILEGEHLRVARFDYPEKLKVALAIAINTLHLHSTPWIEESLTLDNIIFFLHNDGNDVYNLDTVFLDRPFVVKNLVASHRKKRRPQNTPRPVNVAVFSLGALLIQVMIGKTERSLEMVGDMDVGTILAKRDAGKRLFDRLLESGGVNYKTAVEWCFDSVLRVAGLHNDDCCQQFFQEVVSRLEEDVQLLSEY